MSSDLVRFSVAMPEDLLINFDHLVARRGLAKNRSEVIRDLVRDALDGAAHRRLVHDLCLSAKFHGCSSFAERKK